MFFFVQFEAYKNIPQATFFIFFRNMQLKIAVWVIELMHIRFTSSAGAQQS